MLHQNHLKSHEPTRQTNIEIFSINNMTIKGIDIGGHDCMRRLWRDYFWSASAIVYMVQKKKTIQMNIKIHKYILQSVILIFLFVRLIPVILHVLKKVVLNYKKS
jgi:hypothetical protein